MDPETALSAMRNLNGYEINGRALRVDSASNERSELQNLMNSASGASADRNLAAAGPAVNEPQLYGDSVDPEKAPEKLPLKSSKNVFPSFI